MEDLKFTHLHVHTEYSLLDGSSKIPELVKRTKELGMDSIAITDHGVMYGVIDFYKACQQEGIKPIIGCEVYVAPGSRFDRENGGENSERYNHMVLLAENNTGYKNLMKIVSKGFIEGFYYKPRVDYEILEKYHEGIIATSACLAGIIPKFLQRGLYEEAKQEAVKLNEIFGQGNFFLELQDHGIAAQQNVNQGLLRLSKELNIDLIATNDVHYIYDSDVEAHDILLCIQTGKKVSDENRMRYEGGQYYLKSPNEMAGLFPYAKEAISNTYKIAQRCNVEIEFGKYKLPHFDVPEGYTSESYLRKLCNDGLKKRYGEKAKDLQDRLNYELDTISSMGFVDYFLIVWDFIKYAKDNDIPVGPGRGSAAGSLVAYSLNITDLIDPIKYNLIFERFLNPERVTMPDIDVDFCYERRQEVIDYVTQKYGEEKVVQIVTFGTMAARMVIRDVGRVLDLPYNYVDMVAKAIPMELGITIPAALKLNPDLKKLYDVDPDAKKLIDMSIRLEGLPRHTSVHAAGVVISPAAVDDFVPLSKGADGNITTQYTMVTLEELGLLKMDFLGLRTLTVIKNALDGMFDLHDIDYEDKNVYDMISMGHTEGVFQLESEGMKNFMKELKPQSMEDIIAGISLYRPGPMDFIPKYIRGKNDRDNIVYDCPELEPILAPTYGCIVYQEQVMQIVRDLAGYSYGRSDQVRRAMSKKKASVMKIERNNFIYGNEAEGVEGCIKRGISEDIANKIFDEMMDFAKYAFNKSHAAAYAVVSYQTAYLKCYYPVNYMAALLTSFMENTSKITDYILTCRNMNIQVLPPDINEGESDFKPRDGKICFGLAAIKGLGRPAIEEIINERNKGGLFRSFSDFCNRMSNSKALNKRTLESLIKAGALDCLDGSRSQKMEVYISVLEGIHKEKKNFMEGQMSFMDFMDEDQKKEIEFKFPNIPEYDKETILAFEKEVLGVYVSGHPLEDYEELISKNITARSVDFSLRDGEVLPMVRDNDVVIVGGMITKVTIKTTKKNTLMAFLNIEDIYGTLEVVVFPNIYEKCKNFIGEDVKVFVNGRVSVEENKAAKLNCFNIVRFDDMPKKLWFQFENREKYKESEQELLKILEKYHGTNKVCIYLSGNRSQKILAPKYSVVVSDELLKELYEKYGEENVKVTNDKLFQR